MDFKNQLFLSCYHNITALNEEHHVYLVRHKETDKLYVRKFLTRYNLSVFQALKDHPITGVPRIIELQENAHPGWNWWKLRKQATELEDKKAEGIVEDIRRAAQSYMTV